FFEDDKAWACDMDSSGTISFRGEYTVGLESNSAVSSTNGRLVLISTIWIDPHRISCFFINKDGTIDMPIYNNYFQDYAGLDMVFNKKSPVVYIGTDPICVRFKIDYQQKNIFPTTDTLNMLPALAINYSSLSDCLVFSYAYTGPQPPYNVYGIKTIKLLSDGSFTTDTHWLDILSTHRYLSVSPDGRFAVITGLDDPELSVVGIHQDGSLFLIQTIDFPIKEFNNIKETFFTPNGKYAIITSNLLNTPNIILVYSIDQETGKLTRIQTIKSSYNPPLGEARASAVTPDGKYFVYVNAGIPGYPNDVEWFDVFRIEENGTLTWLKDKKMELKGGYSSALTIVPPWRETLAPTQGWLAH
ncbi:MAG: hypothetical protein NT106_07370, partial [Candidatus Sumerlaeota bacterium]|nr:hypothetical protein [Candidatus Sumerlaeota bacterium]